MKKTYFIEGTQTLMVLIFLLMSSSMASAQQSEYQKNLGMACDLFLSKSELPDSILLKLVPGSDEEFGLLYATTGPDNKMYDTQFFYSVTQQIFDKLLKENKDDFYMPCMQLASFADGEFGEAFIDNLDIIIPRDKDRFCTSVQEKEYLNRNPIQYYYRKYCTPSGIMKSIVDELEEELSFFSSGEGWGNKRNIAHQLLSLDSLNTVAINYLVEAYGRSNQKDSISFLFDRLIRENPESPQPYLLRASERNARFGGLTYTQRIKYLKEAHKLDSVNEEAIYSLGKLYYELFIREFKKGGKKVNLDHYSTSANKYFTILFNQGRGFKESLKFPLIQLANYSGNAARKKYFENYRIQSSYFPISAFVDLPGDWRSNYKVNVLEYIPDNEFKISGVELAVFHIRWYASHLIALHEPVLVDTLPAKVFRFTWLRSFHNPVVIRLENINDSITLYWKVSNGAGGYEPGEITVNKTKRLTMKEWEDIVAGINSINFWKLPTIKSEILGTDGAQWVLEGKESGKYHVVDRWSGGIIYNVCLKLLDLTDLQIKQNEIY